MPRPGLLKQEIIEIYWDIKNSGKPVFTRDIAERVTLSKMKGDALKAQIAEYLKAENLPYQKSELGRTTEARTKAAETIKGQRIEKTLSAADKNKLFADIKKYRSGPITGPQQTIKIMDFAKYFPAGTTELVLSRNVNRIANDILKLPDHPKISKPEALEARRAKEALKKKGDPTWVTKKLTGTKEMPLHHMRAKAISPSLSTLTYLDVATNSEKLQNIEKMRDGLIASQKELFEKKPSGWKKELEKLNFKARNYANKIPRELRGLVVFEQMDEFGKFTEKGIGGNPMKSIAKLAPEGEIAFNTLTKESPLRKTILDFAKSNKGGVCGIFRAEGGRIGFAAGSSCVAQMETALRTDPIKTTEQISKLPGNKTINTLKTAAGGFLKTLGRGGVKAAPFAAVAAAGAVAEPLVKQFRNDDPTTYMTDENQQKGVLLSLLESETPQVDEEILKWQYPGIAAGAAAAIPGSGAVYKARRGLPPTKDFVGPMAKGVGKTRAALGLSGVLGKVLGGSFSPLAVAASLPIGIAAQVKGGSDIEDIATDPFNWMGPAFASTGAKMATRGMPKVGILSKALSMGMSPAALRILSRGGIYGLLASAGLKGYDLWKNRE